MKVGALIPARANDVLGRIMVESNEVLLLCRFLLGCLDFWKWANLGWTPAAGGPLVRARRLLGRGHETLVEVKIHFKGDVLLNRNQEGRNSGGA